MLAAERAQLLRPRRPERLVAVLVLLAGVGEVPDVLGLGVDEQAVAQLDQARKLLLGQPEDVSEHADRDRRGELGDEVELALGQRLIEARAHELAQPPLPARHGGRREVGGEEPAVAAVLGRVELEEVAPRGEHVLRQVLDPRRPADLRGEGRVVLEHGADVVELRQHPEAAAPVGLGVEVHGRVALERLEDLPRLVVREEVVVQQIDRRSRLPYRPHSTSALRNVSTTASERASSPQAPALEQPDRAGEQDRVGTLERDGRLVHRDPGRSRALEDDGAGDPREDAPVQRRGRQRPARARRTRSPASSRATPRRARPAAPARPPAPRTRSPPATRGRSACAGRSRRSRAPRTTSGSASGSTIAGSIGSQRAATVKESPAGTTSTRSRPSATPSAARRSSDAPGIGAVERARARAQAREVARPHHGRAVTDERGLEDASRRIAVHLRESAGQRHLQGCMPREHAADRQPRLQHLQPLPAARSDRGKRAGRRAQRRGALGADRRRALRSLRDLRRARAARQPARLRPLARRARPGAAARARRLPRPSGARARPRRDRRPGAGADARPAQLDPSRLLGALPRDPAGVPRGPLPLADGARADPRGARGHRPDALGHGDGAAPPPPPAVGRPVPSRVGPHRVGRAPAAQLRRDDARPRPPAAPRARPAAHVAAPAPGARHADRAPAAGRRERVRRPLRIRAQRVLAGQRGGAPLVVHGRGLVAAPAPRRRAARPRGAPWPRRSSPSRPAGPPRSPVAGSAIWATS